MTSEIDNLSETEIEKYREHLYVCKKCGLRINKMMFDIMNTCEDFKK